MAHPEAGTGFALRLERTIAAPPERVFDAWTDPATVARWFGPTDQYVCTLTAPEIRVGAPWRIDMVHSGGNHHVAEGTYLEIARPSRLSFSWGFRHMPELDRTVVTVILEPIPTGTKLVLLHERFPTAELRERHNQGWDPALDKLVRLF